ncbi:MAG: FHA domain-containing protein [Proteobacteria bacterium]|nr:FHA domain-containing protein [Pseudomonadota bacterium]
MAKNLIVTKLQDSNPQELARLDAPHVVLGRDSGAGLVIPVEGVSRIHGSFIQGETLWLYADEGSTNGSWLNGERLAAGNWKVIRSGDLLQVADVVLQLQEQGGAASVAPTLVAVDSQGVYAEFQLPAQGEALVIGGQNGDLLVDDSDFVEPLATVRVRDAVTELVRHRRETSVILDGEEVAESTILTDNDCIQVGPYQLVLCDPAAARAATTVTSTEVAMAPPAPPAAGLNERRAELAKTVAQTHGVFGKAFEPEPTSTQALTPQQVAHARRSLARTDSPAPDEGAAMQQSQLEDTIIMVLGIGLVGVLLGFGIWWLIK